MHLHQQMHSFNGDSERLTWRHIGRWQWGCTPLCLPSGSPKWFFQRYQKAHQTYSFRVNASECVCLRAISRPCSKQYPFRWDVLIQEEGAQRMKTLSRDGKSLSSSVALSLSLSNLFLLIYARTREKLVSSRPKKPIIFLIIQVLDFVCMCPRVHVCLECPCVDTQRAAWKNQFVPWTYHGRYGAAE